MQKILIIKLGALGDVVRTTPLLRVLKGEITWVTNPNAIPLLKNNSAINHLLEIKQAYSSTDKNYYDLVLNMDEELSACRLAAKLKKAELIGPYESSQGINYTDSSAPWFDMSLISRLGKKAADQKKWMNRKSYQEILFSMLSKKFKGEEYILPYKVSMTHPKSSPSPRPFPFLSLLPLREKVRMRGHGVRADNKLVGVETRAGERWMAKRWPRFPELFGMLKKHKIFFRKFHQSPSLSRFIDQIDQTDFVLTTDSLTLHLALGLKKKIIALFTCTSPQEIYGYSRTIKIVSPLLRRYFYSTEKSLASGAAIAPETVFNSLQKLYR